MIIDIVILGFMAFHLIIGYIKGAVKSLFDLLGYIFAAIVTYLFYAPVKKVLIDVTPLDESIAQFVTERLQALGASSVQAAVSTADLNAMSKLPLPEDVKVAIERFLTDSVSSVSQNVTTEVTNFLMTLVAVIGIFLITLIAVKLIASMLDIIAQLPVVSTFNKVGGVLFGAIKGYIIVSLLFLIFITFFSTSGDAGLQEALNSSITAPFFINYNLFLLVVSYIPQ
ncbi:MAG: hypothetical protein CSA13_00065 [Clostridiales bacterium]|nr:MAG: hypothetical protein CSA13_00065 [Clostridiales bacterium]